MRNLISPLQANVLFPLCMSTRPPVSHSDSGVRLAFNIYKLAHHSGMKGWQKALPPPPQYRCAGSGSKNILTDLMPSPYCDVFAAYCRFCVMAL